MSSGTMSSCQEGSTALRLRVGTFNVHQWMDRNSEHTFDDICSLLQEADLDIIGLQETSRTLLPELISRLGKGHYALAAKFGGTALLTRLPIIENSHGKLGKGRYSCCSVKLPGDTKGQEFSVIVLHLNHKKEETRMKEIQTIVQNVEKEGLPLYDIWMGDFNALSRADYAIKEWNHISQVRNLNFWELPKTYLTSVMTSKPTKKEPLWKGLGLNDSYFSVPASNRSGPLSTCRFGTRIDYIYFRADRLDADGWTIIGLEHVDCKKLSDHNLVIATFEKREKTQSYIAGPDCSSTDKTTNES